MAWRTGLAVLLLALGGCVSMPMVDVGKVGTPKSVAIVDIPDVRPLALIGVITPYAPGPNQFHFSERSDMFFAVPGSKLELGFRTNATGLIPNLIDSQAAETQKKAEAFGAEIVKLYPGFDLRADFMKALRAELEARGASVQVLADGREKAPRLRWPAADAEGKSYPSGSLDSSPPADADIVLEVCPVVMYNSPGPLNNYTLNVTVGVALYNGRTRQFLGRQILRYVPTDSLSFTRYDSLVEDLKRAAPPLRNGLVSLAPLVADLATGRPLKP
jgi:hypothetical protein